MGTRSTTTFVNMNGEKIAKIYAQYDGYPDGFPYYVKDFIKNGMLGNGISGEPKLGEFFNGFDCLTASVIAHFKVKPGYIYMMNPNGEQSEEFNYIITEAGPGKVMFECLEVEHKHPYNEIVDLNKGRKK
jgi:hypothetical protein